MRITGKILCESFDSLNALQSNKRLWKLLLCLSSVNILFAGTYEYYYAFYSKLKLRVVSYRFLVRVQN